MTEDSINQLKQELEDYHREQARIKSFIGQLGGASLSWHTKALNIAFVIFLILFFVLGALQDIRVLHIPFITGMLTLEIGILLVSLKIIWMIHRQSKVEHFQFWILHSIEFRLNSIGKQLREMEKTLYEKK